MIFEMDYTFKEHEMDLMLFYFAETFMRLFFISKIQAYQLIGNGV